MDRINHLFNDHLKGDRTIWMVALLLRGDEPVAVYSASSWMGWRDGGTFRVKHGLMLAAGGGIMYGASKLKYTVYSKLSQVLLGATIGLLLLTLLIGSNVNGASRWLAIPAWASPSRPAISPAWSSWSTSPGCWAARGKNRGPSAK